MPVSDQQLQAMWHEVLTLSKVRKGETVVVLTNQDSNPRYVEAATEVSASLGARPFRIDFPPVLNKAAMGTDPTAYVGATPLVGNKAAMEAMRHADLVIDLMLLLHSPEQEEILKGGTRMLLVYEPPEILARMMPSLEDRRRVLAARKRLGRAKTMRITSDAGTDFSVKLGQFPVLTEYGFSEAPGRWDHWPSGFLATWPNERSAQGRVVLDVGDIIFPFKDYVKSPVAITIKDGYIRKIEGGFDADFLDSYMKTFRDREAYAVSHLGWGLQPKAQWTALGLYDKNQTIGMDGRAFYGNFLFSTGPNTEGGGKRNTPCHMDIPMRNCSVFVDDEPMVVKGKVVPRDQRAAT
ncbi:MAG: 2,5-dihydroxypyridine 5,6-dioxygenase [Alphaproteobacteria bacterium]